MARTKLSGTVLEPAPNPAVLVEEYTIAAVGPTGDRDELDFPPHNEAGWRIMWGDAHEPDGIIRVGERECPRCGSDLGRHDILCYGAERVWPIWYCCFSWCNDGRHTFADTETCPSCNGCPEHCECETCPDCGDVSSSDDFCGTCENCADCCSCDKCDDCGQHESCCECNRMGSLKESPWESRGRVVNTRFSDVDLKRFTRFDPVMAMADFYLLEFLTVLPGGPWSDYWTAAAVFADRARETQRRLVDVFDGVFIDYVDMVVGGEVRHHRSMHTTLSRDRQVAWGEWKSIREALGLEALEDAATLFDDMTNSGGYGGPPWASAARILHARLSGAMDPRTFVDRVFSMQHNNGSLLNKVDWAPHNRAGKDVEWMRRLGNCHAATEPDLDGLIFCASEVVEDLVNEAWPARNRLLASLNRRPELVPSWRRWHRYDADEFAFRGTPAYAKEIA